MPLVSLADGLRKRCNGGACFGDWDSLRRNKDGINSAVLVPIVPDDNGVKVLFIERPDSMRWHAGQIAFPGGAEEPRDKGPLQTALRESYEELGLKPEFIEPLYLMSAEKAVTSGFIIYPIVALVGISPDLSTLVPNRDEVENMFLIDPFDLPFEPLEKHLDYAGSVHSFTEFPLEGGRRIWGVTGRIFNSLINDISGIEESL